MPIMFVVPQSHCVVLERLGKFSRVLKEGLRWRIPILESVRFVGNTWGQVANKRGYLIELTEQQTDTPPRLCHTKDNVPITANASVYWKIVDPRKALYEVDILPVAVADSALNALRANIGSLELDAVLGQREKLNQVISEQLARSSSGKWGVVFTRVEIQELATDKAVSGAMIQQMDAERKRRAQVSEAEGAASAAVMLANAERDATVLRAEGRAAALALIAKSESAYLEAISRVCDADAAMQLLLAQKYIDGFNVISQNPAHKVFFPNSPAGLLPFAAEMATNDPVVKVSSKEYEVMDEHTTKLPPR